MVQEAIDRSRQGNIFDRVSRYAGGGDVNANLEPRVGYDKSAVKDFVNELAGKIDQDAGQRHQSSRAAAGCSRRRASPGAPSTRAQMTRRDQPRRSLARSRPGHPGRGRRRPSPRSTRRTSRRPIRATSTSTAASFTLRFYHHLKLEKSYTIAVGQQGLETPAGLYHALDKQVDPSWHVPNSAWAGSLAGQVIPPGPADPLKARWIGIFDGAGIHGTDDIGSLGSAASHGCVRMSIPDVIDLYDRVQVGDPIYVQ